MDEKIIYEREGSAPEGWETNLVLERNAEGEIIVVEIPDDKEEI